MTAPSFTLRKPCVRCPFRSDKPFPLRPGRAKEFADALRRGGDFLCHKTVDYDDDDDDGDQVVTDKIQWCAGALITMEREGFSNQQVRIAESLGVYDPTRLDMSAPVYGSLAEWVRSYSSPSMVTNVDGEQVELEHCGVVGPECEDPAGYSYSGGAVDNDEDPTCHPDETCSQCGNPMCSACRAEDDEDGYLLCYYCAEEDEDA